MHGAVIRSNRANNLERDIKNTNVFYCISLFFNSMIHVFILTLSRNSDVILEAFCLRIV